MVNLIINWLLLAAAVWITALILPGFKVRGFGGALVVGAVFGLLNWAIGWLLFIAIGIGTLGLGFLLAFVTRWVVDAIVLKITDALTQSLKIRSFFWALMGALVMSLLGTAGEYLLGHGPHTLRHQATHEISL